MGDVPAPRGRLGCLGPLRLALLAALVGCSGPDSVASAPDAAAGPKEDGATSREDGATSFPEDGGGAEDAAAPASDGGALGPRYDEVVFAATHNSYSGGARGTVLEQLEAEVRFLELDLHDNDYAAVGDYRLGHDAPGHEVASGSGNPSSQTLGAWLELIASWSLAHPDHAPITLGLDLKDDLTDNPSHAAGNLAALGDALERAFGERLLTPAEVGPEWPAVDALRGRVIGVLSGHEQTRVAYSRDSGHAPAVAMNGRGQVVEVHDSGSGTLWYWTGEYLDDGTVRWHRHGRYDTGQTPAVALNDDGWIVEVHQSESASTLWYHVGRLRPDFEIEWSDSRQYDTGVRPTVRFVDPAGTAIREIHRSENESQHWYWEGALDVDARAVAWGAHARTMEPLHDKTTATSDTRRVVVFTGPSGSAPEETLLYGTHRVGSERIAYWPRLFVEMQDGNDPDLARRFFAAPSGRHSLAGAWQAAGGVVRLWGFDEADTALSPPPQLPATDTPHAEWYRGFCEEVGCVP